MSTQKYLTTKQFSEATGLHIKVIYANIQAKRIKSYRQAGVKSNHLIPASEVDNFVKRKPISHV